MAAPPNPSPHCILGAGQGISRPRERCGLGGVDGLMVPLEEMGLELLYGREKEGGAELKGLPEATLLGRVKARSPGLSQALAPRPAR